MGRGRAAEAQKSQNSRVAGLRTCLKVSMDCSQKDDAQQKTNTVHAGHAALSDHSARRSVQRRCP